MPRANWISGFRGYASRIWRLLVRIYDDFDQYNYLAYAASIAFFFLLSVFPMLIFRL